MNETHPPAPAAGPAAPAAPPVPAKIAAGVIADPARAIRRARIAEARAGTPEQERASARRDGRTTQSSLLVMAEIRAGQMEPLKALLKEVAEPEDEDLELNAVIPFAHLRTVHFLRLVIHEPSPSAAAPVPRYPWPDGAPQADGPPIPPTLLFATDFDGPLDEHLDELLRVAAPGLDRVFSHCEGWPGVDSPSAVHGWMLRHRLASDTFYTGTKGRSVEQIHREAELHDRIEAYLDAEAGRPGFPTDPLAVRERIVDWVNRQPGLVWTREVPGPYPTPLFDPALLSRVLIGAGVAIVAALAVVLRLVLGAWTPALLATLGIVAVAGAAVYAAYRYLLRLQATDPVIIPPELVRRETDLAEAEDRIVQNQMSSVIYIKRPLWFRGLVLRAVLRFVDFSAQKLSVEGTLAGIPSIHFARWVIVDGGRRLVFFSNFDGSWENYLGDFIDKSHTGLTAVWSNCVGFPRTTGLFQGGAEREQQFKAYSRASQIPTQVWYSAYRWLSVENINNNSWIRLGLYGEMTEDQAAAWLRRFGGWSEHGGPALSRTRAAVPTPPKVELDDVQGLVARSYGALKHASYVPVRLSADDAAAGRAWVGEMAARVTPASVRGEAAAAAGRALNLAFTPDGLRRLGMDADAVRGFSLEFVEGMTTEHRRRILGDLGPAAPEAWAWGGPDDELHAMLFLFAGSGDGLAAMMADEEARAARHGVRLGAALGSIMLPEDKEHFGFHDGIAQPRVLGFRPADDGESPAPTENPIPAGEVVLGYPNAYGQVPESPVVPDSPAARATLPAATPDPDLDIPAGARDLGRNGSYVVFRQLEQHVRAFWQFVDAQAADDAAARKKLAAKMVGRWPNGTPLVQSPDEEPATFDAKTGNRFMYSGRWDDLHGDKCPFGAHIRRTNPRDGMQPGPAGSLVVADRHRLLRRGRAYGAPLAPSFDPADVLASAGEDDGRGLHFICFNTDLGRQFEFVQGTWVNGMKFDGLYADPDPLVAPHVAEHPEEVAVFTQPGCPVRHRTLALPRFVTMRGGAYLFMPGLNALKYLATME